MTTDETVGVECPVCHEEAFQLVPREVTHIVDVCPRCVRRVDADLEEQMIQEATKGLSKSERRSMFQEQSFEWADKLHGKKVIVYWHQRDSYGGESEHESQVLGRAYQTTNECGGWGKLKVIIDDAEHYRIELKWTYRIEYSTGKHCPYQKPRIDGQKYGLYLNLDSDGSYYTLVSWGGRKALAQ